MTEPLIFAAVGAFTGALIALLVYHATVVRPALVRTREALAVQDDLLGAGSSASTRLGALSARTDDLGRLVEGFGARLHELEELARTDVSRIGFVRYDAFDDTFSDLSYALAVLNREGDGVVLSSIYSRNDTRTFGKAVCKFEPLANASEEELRAIAQARGDANV